ncbi:MAG: hypothetical protein ACQETD_09040 [Pseudomonadota bacterium]
MQAIIDFLQANPFYAVGAAVLLVLFIISLVKKAVMLAAILIVLNAGYGYYLHDAAQTYLQQAQQRYETVREGAGEASDKAGDLFQQADDKLKR